MTALTLVEQLMALPDVATQRHLLESHRDLLDDSVADALKTRADQFLRSEINRSLETADLLVWMADLTGNQVYRALGLLAEANARSIGGLGEYQRSVELYDEAADIYRDCGQPLQQARAQVGKVFSLAFLGRYEEAMETGRWAGEILERHGQWRLLATLTMNMAIAPGRQGEDAQALALFERARKLYEKLGPAGEPFLPLVDQNRATVLRNLGQFDVSIQASLAAWERAAMQGQLAEVARAQTTLAFTYFMLGRYNEALSLLDQARDAFLADGRESDAVRVDLDISKCLLQLRRFTDVLKKSQQFQTQFARSGTRREVAESLLNEAVARTGLGQYHEAQAIFGEARRLFLQEGYLVWAARTDLETASVLHYEHRFCEALGTAESCAAVFQERDLPVLAAEAQLVAARAAIGLELNDKARQLLVEVLRVGESKGITSLVYQSRHLLGLLAESEGRLEETLVEFDLALKALEQLRGRLMVEHRANFLEDKQDVYEDIVRVCLELNQPGRGLEYAERAKSRALVDMLAFRLNVGVQALGAEDAPLVEELTRLRNERDRLYRRWESHEQLIQGVWPANGSDRQIEHEVLALEDRITELWHKLLIRNASYARDASLWQMHTEPIQPFLAHDTALLEYFTIKGAIIAFVATRSGVQAVKLDAHLAKVQQLIKLLQLNLRAVPRSQMSQAAGLIANAQGILSQLYALLMAPVNGLLADFPRISVVPHGPLHYLPMPALFDGHQYLVERHQFTHLPGASLLRFCSEPRPAGHRLLAIGNSFNGRLPHTVNEARSIAAAFHGETLLEEQASTVQLRKSASQWQVIHIAAHGDFRPDNPLFSGLALADRWLTTLDIFDLRLNASLVTLSACQTGRSVVGGGDELLGLMRAFLYAGAASLMLSLWAVEDRSTAQLMSAFYDQLSSHETKGAALRAAQLQFIHGWPDAALSAPAYRHPYYWAPFFLVGDNGPL